MLGVPVAVRCNDPEIRRLFVACYGRPAVGRPRARSLQYSVARSRASGALSLVCRRTERWRPRGTGELLYRFDGDLSVQVQRRRPDLYFLHSAVLARHGRAALLVGSSGVGKSTAAWALTHHGFEFKGDELAPIDVRRLRVYPYFRALCLKSAPPAQYPLPPAAHRTSRGWHVPARLLPGGCRATSLPVAAIFFPQRAAAGADVIRQLGQAEALVHLYANSLNALAHRDAGLAPAVRLVRAVPAYEVRTADLESAAAAIAAVLAGQGSPRRSASADER